MSTLDTGEAGLPTIVCLHSLFLDPRMFDGLVEAASGRFRVVRPTFRGQAERIDEATGPVSMDTCAADVVELLEGLAVGPVVLVAQSMGADVAVRVAARHPELVGRMVLLGGSACAEPPANVEAFSPIADEVEQHGFTGQTLETTMAIMFGGTTRADRDRSHVVELWQERIAALDPRLCHAIRGVIGRESAVGLLPSIPAPTLVVSGTEDIARPPAWSDELVEGLQDATLWRLEGVGHSPVLEVPDRVLPRILEFAAG
ncbi:MAG TPA: alpha/beta hydrolase [Mycobacteriales bacterium]|nr:alpha/beta hydrolase [Mycobacteriales bacterium]